MPGTTAIRILREEELETSAAVIRAAFAPQARRFGLTRANCSGNGAFVTRDRLAALHAAGAVLLGSFSNADQTGFIAIKRASRPPHRQLGDGPVCCLEKLAVLPEAQRRGHGGGLVRHGLLHAARLGAHSVCIGIIADAGELRTWYEKQGFTSLGTKNFPSLPFTVLYMGRALPQSLPHDPTTLQPQPKSC